MVPLNLARRFTRAAVRLAETEIVLCEGARQYRVDLGGLHEEAVVAPLRADDLQVDARRVSKRELPVYRSSMCAWNGYGWSSSTSARSSTSCAR
jgi:hypothetical protein